MARKLEKTVEKEIRKALITELESREIKTAYFIDLVEDYISLWKTKNLLVDDINKRGIVIESVNVQGVTISKKNDTVDQIVKINQQMMKILDNMKIKPEAVRKEIDEKDPL